MEFSPAEAKEVAQTISLFRYTAVATIAFLVYDYALVIEEEIRLVWVSRLSPVKILYLLNRLAVGALVAIYSYQLLGDTDPASCKTLIRVLAQFDALIFITSESILFMRVYAIWHYNKIILAALGILFVIGFSGLVTVAAIATSGVQAGSFPSLFGKGCLIMYIGSEFWIFFLVVLVQEIMILLVLLRAFLVTRSEAGHVISKGYQLLVKDGIAYFICIFLISLANIFIVTLAPIEDRTVFFATHGAVQSVLCTRLLLRLRDAFKKPDNEPQRSTWSVRSEPRRSARVAPIDELDSIALYEISSTHIEHL